MSDILTRAGCFLAIILMGYVLRRIGFFKKEDFILLSRIVIRITLTASIVVSFSGRELDPSMLILSVFGLGFGILMMFFGNLLFLRDGREGQAFGVLNLSGCNIGNFVLPFAQSFLGPVGVMCASIFDLGNSFICLGGAYSVAEIVKKGSGKFSPMPVIRQLFRSVPFVTYLTMTALSVLHITLPSPVVEFAGIIGNANAFLAMLMLGVGFTLTGDIRQTGTIVKMLAVRFGSGILLAVLTYFLLPIPLEYRQALVIVFLAPIASAAPGFTADLKSDFGLASAVNSIGILVSIVLITSALIIMI